MDILSHPVTATVPVTTSDAALVATEKALISATVGVPVPDNTGGSGALVATFTDGNPLAGADDFTATIDWGDGTSSAGTVTPLGGGVFAVSGTHTFGTPGNDTVTVTIVDRAATRRSRRPARLSLLGPSPDGRPRRGQGQVVSDRGGPHQHCPQTKADHLGKWPDFR